MKKGFIDPISLITFGILLVGLVISTAIVKNPKSLDIRNWARMSTGRCPNGAHAPDGDISLCPQKPPAKTTTTSTTPTAQTQPTEESRFVARQEAETQYFQAHPEQKPSPPPTVAPTSKCSSFGSCYPANYTCEKEYGQMNCSSGSKCGGHCSAPTPTPTSKPTPTPTSVPTPATPTQPTEESRFVARQEAETQYFQAHPEQKPSPPPTVAPTSKCSSFGSCYPANYTCEKDYGQMDCGRASRCGIHCSAPAPAPITITKSDYQKCLDDGNTPGECSPVAQNIGKTITTPTGQKECNPNKDKPFCSGNNLKTCSASGTWGLQTCQYGCANSACKPAPAPVAQLPESVTYQPGALPPQLAAVNPPNDPLSLTQDTMMAATLNQKIQGCLNKGFTQNQCSQAFQQAADTKDTCVAFYMLENPNSNFNQTVDRCTQERANAALVAAATYGAGYVAFNPVLITPKTIAAANLVDDTATAIACAKGNQNACAYVLPAIANPIPGMSLASQYADDLTALAKPITNFFDEAASIMRLPDANNPAGWTLGTYGRQTSLANLSPEELNLFRMAEGGLTNKIFDADSTLNPLVSAATGGQYNNINDPEFIMAMMNDTVIIQQKYNLPSAELKSTDPGKYISTLINQSEQLGIPVVDTRNFTRFHQENPIAGGAFYHSGDLSGGFGPEPFIAVNPSYDLPKQASNLTHEFIHVNQSIRYPGMPIEIMEYEAYVGSMKTPLNLLESKVRDFLFGFNISGSSSYFYQTQGIVPLWK